MKAKKEKITPEQQSYWYNFGKFRADAQQITENEFAKETMLFDNVYSTSINNTDGHYNISGSIDKDQQILLERRGDCIRVMSDKPFDSLNLHKEIGETDHRYYSRVYVEGLEQSRELLQKELKEDIEILRKDNETLKEENNSLKEDIEALREENNSLREENNSLREKNNALNEENETLDSLVTDYEEELEELEKENDAFLKENSNLIKENSILRKENSNLIKENSNLRKENSNLIKDVPVPQSTSAKSYVDTYYKYCRDSEITDSMRVRLFDQLLLDYKELLTDYCKVKPDLEDLKEDYYKLSDAYDILAYETSKCTECTGRTARTTRTACTGRKDLEL